MKILKLIGLMLLTANFVMAQVNTTSYGTNAGEGGDNNSYFGFEAGLSITGVQNTFIGSQTGKNVGTKGNNTFVGAFAGASAAGAGDTFIGANAGRNAGVTLGGNTAVGESALRVVTGSNNMAIGTNAGRFTTTGSQNVFMGSGAGMYNVTGYSNILLGNLAGQNHTEGVGNVLIGQGAGQTLTSGNKNVFIGNGAGNSLASAQQKLYIESSSDATNPLIYGDFASGKVGIETTNIPTDYTLAVNGKTITTEVQVMLYDEDNGGWPDYVFAEDYHLMPLTDLEAEIETLGHLPGVPSAEEVEENGHALGRMDAILLEKIEELTLHLIDMNKEMTDLRERNEALETRLSEVEDK